MKARIKNKNGLNAFTIIELIVVITVVAVLATLAIITYGGIREDTRDATRGSNATIISEGLEKYYEKNGEYPSVASLVNTVPANTGTAVASKLSISIDSLRMPLMPSSATNSLTLGPTPSNDYIAYIGRSDVNDTRCQSDTSGGCDRYTLRYIEESGTTINIESRRKGRASDTPTTSDTAGPTLSAAIEGSNVVVTVEDYTPCDPTSLSPKFAYKYRTRGGDDSSWSRWSNPTSTWSASLTYSVPGNAGTSYEFTSYSRCDNGSTPGAVSLEGAVESIDYPLEPPVAPTISLIYNANGTITFVISAVTCAPGTTAQYSYRWHNSTNSYGGWSTWGGGRAWVHTPTAGYSYYYQPKARCAMTNIASDEAIGPETTHYPVALSAPNAPVVAVTPTSTNLTWNWSATGCPGGSTTEYQTRLTNDNPYDTGWRTPTTTASYAWYTATQGSETTLEVQARCVASGQGSPWSTSGSASYLRPISTPGAPTNWSASLSADRLTYSISWTRPTCGSGTQSQNIWDGYIEPPGTWESTGASGWEGWKPQAYYSTTILITKTNNAQFNPGEQHMARAQYVCKNNTTGRQGDWGPIGTSPLFTTP